MYLSKLEIFGFKSFAQKTAINFNEGITSIVGPNGCGKTNVVDAIRWCLGEQRSGVLRSDKMENVIFNGTSHRKPMGMAEVSLTIENTKGILPTDYTDVTITRRIFRSGESEYLLNKNICRLKDITNLFMDTGIGANAYSVIELKMVETILSNKADERRTMFEEAAGVNKYKLRRRLALKKLDEVKSDLNRVNDIVSEVEKKVNSLERQAKRADRYNALSSQLREMELDLAERELALFGMRTERLKREREDNFKLKLNVESDIAKFDDEIGDLKQKLSEIENELLQVRNEISDKTETIFRIQNLISIKNERKSSLDANSERFNQELGDFKTQLVESERLIENGDELLKHHSQAILSKEDEKSTTEENLSKLTNELGSKKEILKVQSEVLLGKIKIITNKENELKNIQNSLTLKNQAITKLNEKILLHTNTIAKTVGFVEELTNEKDGINKKIEEAESFYIQKQNEKIKLESEVAHLKEKEFEQKTFLQSLKEKISFVQNLIDNLEGVSKGAKALLDNKAQWKGDITILAHIGESEAKYRLAIEAALKNNLNNVLVESLEDLKNGIEFLKKNEIGKAAFFSPANGSDAKKGFLSWLQQFIIKRKSKKLAREAGFVGWANDFIKCESKWKVFFEKILSNTCIVDNLDSAFQFAKKYDGFNFAALNGDYISELGIIEAGSSPKLDDSLFGRKQFLEELKRELPVHDKKFVELQKEILWKEEQLSSIDLNVLSEKGRMLVNDLANVEKQISQFEFEIQKTNDEIDKTQKEIKDHASEANDLDNELTKVQELLSNEEEAKVSEENKRVELEVEISNLQKNYDELVVSRNNISIDIERLIGEKKNTENSIKRAQDSISSIKLSISKRETDIQTAQNDLVNIAQEILENNSVFSDKEKEKTQLLGKQSEIDARFKLVRDELTAKEKSLKEKRIERENLSETIHESDIQLKELDIKTANLIEHVKETYSISLEKKYFDDLENFDYQQRHVEVNEIRNRIKNLGPINLLAYSEYDEEKQRLDFLLKQRDDLLESERDVVKTIEEINQTAQALFSETFNKIRENFIKIFRTLFDPGDEADLKIEENADPLEAKIEIIAKPKGKRPTSIDLLSGGEKTLTAIALLFAIYLVKPSPFCILDEIDAPLDDANIDRFTRILNEFNKDTQFIVVTHNKRTMESAETMYGVTMQEEGVSKLVSVRFNEDLDFIEKN